MIIPSWLLWTAVTLLSWGVWAILSKLIGPQISPAHSQVLSTIGIVPIIGILGWQLKSQNAKNPSIIPHRRFGISLAFCSGMVSSIGNIPFYYLLSGGNHAASAVAVTALAPLVTILLAVAFLHEHLNRVQWFGIVLALIAIYLFNDPGENELISPWLLMALIPICLWGLTGFLQKIATNYISGRQSAFWFLVAFIPVAGLIAVWDRPPLPLTGYVWLLTALIGFTLAFGNLTILMAFASGGKASIISPMSNLYPLVSAPIAVLAFGEKVTWLGVGVAMASVIAIARDSSHPITPATSTDSKGTDENDT